MIETAKPGATHQRARMTTPRIIPADLLRVQIEASDPAASAWVAANAGSGKTHVLAQRVIRLLLDGVNPSRILCITFTKAAAANMANRVFDALAKWTTLDDESLDKAIREISNVRPTATVRAQARRLFANALETPGGLKVQTIHAFCTRLLQQFPFEANVAARFTVLDEAAEEQLLNRTSMGVMLDAARSPMARSAARSRWQFRQLPTRPSRTRLREAIRKRDMVTKWIAHAGSVDAAVSELCEIFRISVDETVEQVDAETVNGALIPLAQWLTIASELDRGSKTDKEHAARLRAAAAASGEERANIYRGVFLTDKLEPRARVVTAKMGDLARLFTDERDRVCALLARRNAIACRDRTRALLTIAEAVISRYQAEKDRRGLLDYDDLIDKSLALLGEERAAWVHYKLDQGIDHVLIDEAQDTSPKQWEIIRRLTAEFFAGLGAREVRRTIFAVGDEKQSIFSFQGAAPREFDVMRSAFTTLAGKIDHELRQVKFQYSFRSGPNVLDAVDKVFERPEALRGLSADEVKPVHQPLPDAAPGVVEVWPLVTPDEKREIEAWDAPFDAQSEKSPQVRLAAKIAKHVACWSAQGVRPGEVLVLVRQRGALFEAIIRALKDAGVAVAGADRLVLTEHIAVMDLMVLADALLLPDDDLALATVLKSPLFGLDDDDLFAIAWQRRGSLRAALRAKAATEPRFAAASEKLDRFAEWARRDSPFAFYARVLGPERGRRQFFSRLGHEADDALSEFLNLALDYETRETPSLQGFIAWLRMARTDVKRDMEINRDEVRVMTVHGAKGLEARIVILADTTTPPAGPAQHQPRLLPMPTSGRAPGAPVPFAWAGLKATDFSLITAAREAARDEAAEEYRRLLYVGMTRAIDRLVVCGFEGLIRRQPHCWYNLVFEALKPPFSIEEAADDGDGKVWRYRKAPAAGRAGRERNAGVAAAEDLPAWLLNDAPVEAAPVVALSPSRALDEATPLRFNRGSNSDRKKALARGVLVHGLLQALPDIPMERRAEAARRYLERAHKDFSEAERDAIAEQVRVVLDDPRFAELFSPGSRAEVPIVGRLNHNGRVVPISGQVDRLVVTAGSRADRRLQDESSGTAAARGRPRIRDAACALPRGSGQALSEP